MDFSRTPRLYLREFSASTFNEAAAATSTCFPSNCCLLLYFLPGYKILQQFQHLTRQLLIILCCDPIKSPSILFYVIPSFKYWLQHLWVFVVTTYYNQYWVQLIALPILQDISWSRDLQHPYLNPNIHWQQLQERIGKQGVPFLPLKPRFKQKITVKFERRLGRKCQAQRKKWFKTLFHINSTQWFQIFILAILILPTHCIWCKELVKLSLVVPKLEALKCSPLGPS